MLVELQVENVAVIESARLPLGPGLTVLTGETGAGKSLLVDAIQLALGDRADTDLIRSGARRALVKATFELDCPPEGVEVEGGRIVVLREVLAEGRSQCRMNGKVAPVAQLKALGDQLVDLHGQHDHQSLLHPDRHAAYLDGWIGEQAMRAAATVREAFTEWEDAKRRLASLTRSARDREQRLDLLRYQIAEIGAANPQPGELAHLEATIQRLQSVERLREAVLGAMELLSRGEGCAQDKLGEAVRRLDAAARYDEGLLRSVEGLRTALFGLEEAMADLSQYEEGLEADPEALHEAIERADVLRKLRRKYGDDEEAILAYLHRAHQEASDLSDSEAGQEELEERVQATQAALWAAAQALRDLRTAHAPTFASLVTGELRELALERAEFGVRMTERPIDVDGFDFIEFLFSANLGEAMRPLAKIASGGEVSRVMLAIKTVLAGRAGVPTLIFDEVDTGLSGRTAAVVARKLAQLAKHRQVVAISHLPQIASRADTHFRIQKSEVNGRVATTLVELDGEARVEEVARMLAGERVSETALANARELLSAKS